MAAFSPGDFKPLGNKSTKPTTPEASTEEMQNVNSEETNKVAGVYSCPQDGCVRIFQRVSALEKHLSLEKCTPSPERHTVIDLAKMGHKSALEEGVGVLPNLKPSTLSQDYPIAVAKEGWALRAVKKAYRFSAKQKSYLLAKFRIGQTTGRKLDAEVVKCAVPVVLTACDFFSHQNSLPPRRSPLTFRVLMLPLASKMWMS